MPDGLAVSLRLSESIAVQRLAPALTQRLGPTRARRLVEHFAGMQNIFKASLTELEATGIQAVSAQALGTGQSMESAHDENGTVCGSGSFGCLPGRFNLSHPAETDLRSSAHSL